MKKLIASASMVALLCVGARASAEIYDNQPFFGGARVGYGRLSGDDGESVGALSLQGKIGVHTPCSPRHYLCAIGGYASAQGLFSEIAELPLLLLATGSIGGELFFQNGSLYAGLGGSQLRLDSLDVADGLMAELGADIRLGGPVGIGVQWQHFDLMTNAIYYESAVSEELNVDAFNVTFNVMW